MRKSLFLFALPMLAVALFIGCEGDEGPAGPQGDQGIQGIQGEQGEPGTANVIYSDWISTEGDWRDSSFYGDCMVTHTDVAELTSAIINDGVVLCYYKPIYSLVLPGTIPSVIQLPFTSISGTYNYTIDFWLKPGRIIFRSFTHDNSATFVPESTFGYAAFRYVLIPGGVDATAKKSTLDFTKLSYEEVCELFDIPE